MDCAGSGTNYYYSDPTRPYRLSSITGQATLGYDAKGNLTARGSDLIEYTVFNKPEKITTALGAVTYRYGPNRARYYRRDTVTGEESYIIGNVELIFGGGKDRYRRSIGSHTSEVYWIAEGSAETNYLLKDHLGSITAVVDEHGRLVERLSYDPFGQRRRPNDWAIDPAAWLAAGPSAWVATNQGFTGHEMIDSVGLIHMNGRVYDPVIGRFLSVDPVIQEPGNAQNLNRYSYVLNNPLSLTDPSGYSFVSEYWRTIASIAITVVAPYVGVTEFWGSVGTGFVAGYVATGNIRGALTGAFSAGVFHGIGAGFGECRACRAGDGGTFGTNLTKSAFIGKVGAHGIAGGVMTELQGGKFGHGFASAGITQAFAGRISRIDHRNAGFSIQRTIAAAVVGGTASAASGGKFANGAVTGAFSRAFNDELHFSGLREAKKNLARSEYLSLLKQGITDIGKLHRYYGSLKLDEFVMVTPDLWSGSGDPLDFDSTTAALARTGFLLELQHMHSELLQEYIAVSGPGFYFGYMLNFGGSVIGAAKPIVGIASSLNDAYGVMSLVPNGSQSLFSSPVISAPYIVPGCSYPSGCDAPVYFGD